MKAVKLTDRIIAATKSLFDPDAEDQLQARIDELDRHVAEAERETAVAIRQKDDFYALVERMQNQRDEWRETYHTAVETHLATLSALEQALANERLNLQRLALAYNALRSEHGLERVVSWDKVPAADAPPVGLARDYLDAMKELLVKGVPYARAERKGEDRPSDTDGIEERAKVIEVRVLGADRPE